MKHYVAVSKLKTWLLPGRKIGARLVVRPRTTSLRRGVAPRRGPRRAAGAPPEGRRRPFFKNIYLYVSIYSQCASNPLGLSSCRRGAGCLRMLRILQRNKDKMTINKHQIRISWGHRVSAIRGALRSRGYQAITHVLHQLLKSLGISFPFSSCLRPASSLGRGKRQQFQSNSQRK